MATGSPREMLNSFNNGMGNLNAGYPEQLNAFMHLLESIDKPGKVDAKTKELISVGIAVVIRCEYCIVFHVYKALEAGATKEEVMEAGLVGVTFAGGPAMTHVVTLLMNSIEEFAPDFK